MRVPAHPVSLTGEPAQMIKRIKAAWHKYSVLLVFAIPLLMVAGLLYGSITVWPAPRVEDGGTITMKASEFDDFIERAFNSGYECGRKPSGSDLATRSCTGNGCSAQLPPATGFSWVNVPGCNDPHCRNPDCPTGGTLK